MGRRRRGLVALSVLVLAVLAPMTVPGTAGAETGDFEVRVRQEVVGDVATITALDPHMSEITFWFDDDEARTVSGWDLPLDVDARGLTEGEHVLHATAEGATAEAMFTVDHTPPSLSVIPTDGREDDDVFYPEVRPLSWHLHATDTSAVQLSCNWSDGWWDPCANDEDYRPVKAAYRTYDLDVTATDAAGNSTTVRRTFSYLLHPDAPQIVAPSVAGADATIVFSSTAPGVSYECFTTDVPAWTACTSPVNAHFTSERARRFTVRVVYPDGSVGPSNTASISVDLTAPYWLVSRRPADLVGPNDAPLRWAFVTVSGTMPILCSLTLATAAPMWAPCPTPLSFEATPQVSGTYRFQLKGSDAVGNVGTFQDTFSYDATPPRVTVSGPVRHATHERVFTINADEALGSQECRIDARDWAACAGELVVTRLLDGRHTLAVRGTDQVGNVATVSRAFDVDDTGPVVAFGGRPMKTVWLHGKKQKAVTYSLKADEPTVFFCQLDGGAWHRCVATAQPRTSVSFDLKLRRGTHKLRVYGVDRFGNRGATIRASRFVKR